MIYLLTQMVLCLALAGLAGGAAGWLLHRARTGREDESLRETIVRQHHQLRQAEADVIMLTDDFDDLKQRSQTELETLRRENRRLPTLLQNLDKSQTLVRQLMQKHEAQLRDAAQQNESLRARLVDHEELRATLARTRSELESARVGSGAGGVAGIMPAIAAAASTSPDGAASRIALPPVELGSVPADTTASPADVAAPIAAAGLVPTVPATSASVPDAPDDAASSDGTGHAPVAFAAQGSRESPADDDAASMDATTVIAPENVAEASIRAGTDAVAPSTAGSGPHAGPAGRTVRAFGAADADESGADPAHGLPRRSLDDVLAVPASGYGPGGPFDAARALDEDADAGLGEGPDEADEVDDIDDADDEFDELDDEDMDDLLDESVELLFEPVDRHDDLQRIFGIGPVTERALNRLGITSYSQLAELQRHEVEQVADALQIYPGRIERDDWVGNARRQLEDVLEEL